MRTRIMTSRVFLLTGLLALSGCAAAQGIGAFNSSAPQRETAPAAQPGSKQASQSPLGAPSAPGAIGGGAQPASSAAGGALRAAPLTAPSASPLLTGKTGLDMGAVELAQPTPSLIPVQQEPYFYLSYDDSASTAAVELTKHQLRRGMLPNSDWARPWEFLNYESFSTESQSTGLFNVSMGLWQHAAAADNKRSLYDLGVHVSSPQIDKKTRRNLVLTAIVDVSGSMGERIEQTADFKEPLDRLDLAKLGLETLGLELKNGDVINLVSFSDNARTRLKAFAYDGSNLTTYQNAVNTLSTEGGTNLNSGVDEGYRVAQASYDPAKINRVVMLTDAHANVGEVDPAKISTKTRINNAEGIYFSGLGFGADFNEAFLDKLTETGKGAYFAVTTPYDAKRAFSTRLMALVNVAARNLQFRIDFPTDLVHEESAAEQVSQFQSEVLPTNFSFNTSQFFLEGFAPRADNVAKGGKFKLTIAYGDPETGEKRTEIYEKSVDQILGQNLGAIQDAYTITLLTALLKGTKTAAVVKADLAGPLAGHQTTLGTEYRELIGKLIALRGANLPQ